MKMLIEKNILMEGINAVSRALSTRNIVPVLNGIKFDLKNEGLYLTATDNDITIQYFIDKKDIKSIEDIGCLIIYGKSLLEIVTLSPISNIERDSKSSGLATSFIVKTILSSGILIAPW